jgi:hypothetical protein
MGCVDSEFSYSVPAGIKFAGSFSIQVRQLRMKDNTRPLSDTENIIKVLSFTDTQRFFDRPDILEQGTLNDLGENIK